MRVANALALFLGAVVIAGCSLMGVRPPWQTSGITLEGEPEIGVAYRVEVYTHCGLRNVEFDGDRWAISGVLNDGSGNPPPGFNNPIDEGTVTLATPDTAIYTSEFGERRELTRGDGLPPVAGCL